MSGRYAESTSVSSSSSRAEIERTLRRYGATEFAYGWSDGRAVLGFVVAARPVRFVLPMPDPAGREFTHSPTGRARTAAAAETAHEQAVRQRWRALALVVKAKLEAVAAGIVTFDEEFLAHLVMPDGSTVGQAIVPRLDGALSTASLLPAIGGRS